MSCHRYLLIACVTFAAVSLPLDVTAEGVTARIVSVNKIWDAAPHNAFTDLLKWQDQYVCAFREGRGHASTDGTIRVLVSNDGDAWESAASLSLDGYDLRDASLSIMPDGRLLLNGGVAPREQDGKSCPTGTFTATATAPDKWTNPKIIIPPGRWLWRLSWHDGTAWGVDYQAGSGPVAASLLKTTDGIKVDTHVAELCSDGRPTEAVIRFAPDETMICLMRRDGKPDANSALLGTSSPPYADWEWKDLGMYLGGPNLIRTPAGIWLAAGRVIGKDGAKTVVAQLNIEEGTLTSLVELPSGGDTSYPGLAFDGDELLVSYYSSHEQKSSIYLARIELSE